MEIKLGETRRWMFGTADPATGEATDADSTPTATVREQGTAMGYSPTVTSKATGLYEVAVAVESGNGFEVGKEYTLEIAATVDSKTGRDGIAAWIVRTNSTDDVADKVDAVDDYVDTEVAAIKAKTDQLSFTSGNVNAQVKGMDADTVTASALAADAGTEIANAVDTKLSAEHDSGSWAGGTSITAEDVLNAFRAWSHDSGATWEGLMKRLEAFMTGKAEDQNGPHSIYRSRDGNVAFEGAVDPVTGQRAKADISGSE